MSGHMVEALIQIAKGNKNNPMSGERARQIARAACVAAGIEWDETTKQSEIMKTAAAAGRGQLLGRWPK